MKVATCIFSTATFLFTSASLDPFSSDFIDSINQLQSTWIAELNDFIQNITSNYFPNVNGFLGFDVNPRSRPEIKKYNFNSTDIPKTFDARKKWPNCPSLRAIRNQGACNSCWAFAAVETMSDRICILSSGAQNFQFSPEDLLSCCTDCGDCSGGYMMAAYNFYINKGLVSGGDFDSNEGCRPYSIKAFSRGETPACVKHCRKGYSPDYVSDKHYGRNDYIVDSSVEQIQYEIMTNGPIIVNFELFQDFYHYKSGVYYHVIGDSASWHVVKMIGWGTENGIPYWLIANSWGSDWGDKGFFKIRRGYNEVGIEENPYAAMPKL